MLDSFNRPVTYMRISVTDRCNIRCQYCMPEEPCFIDKERVLSADKIIEVVEEAVRLGFSKFRLTGGEPLLRKDILDIVRGIASVEGVTDFGMTTNGLLLGMYAVELKKAGLHRINVHIDTVDEDRFSEITRGGDLKRVLSGIEEAQLAGFDKIKLNCVISDLNDEQDREEVAYYARENNLEARFIKEMSLSDGEFWKVLGGEGGDCENCNRIRMSCEGNIYPCLFSDMAYSIKEHGITEAITRAISLKPESGETANRSFNVLGG